MLGNTNGFAQHAAEVKTYIQNQNADIILISETLFTTKSYIQIPNYTIYDTQHPDGTAHGGTAIVIKNGIKCHLHGQYNLEHLQPTSVTIEDWIGPLTIAAVYCPPKHTVQTEQFRSFYATLGQRFLAGGDYNAKHSHWGSRLITPRGRELFKAMQSENLSRVSTGEPTYWPSDRRKVPDLIDFGVVTRILVKQPTCGVKLLPVLGSLPSYHNYTFENHSSNQSTNPQYKENKTGRHLETILGKTSPSMYPSRPTGTSETTYVSSCKLYNGLPGILHLIPANLPMWINAHR